MKASRPRRFLASLDRKPFGRIYGGALRDLPIRRPLVGDRGDPNPGLPSYLSDGSVRTLPKLDGGPDHASRYSWPDLLETDRKGTG